MKYQIICLLFILSTIFSQNLKPNFVVLEKSSNNILNEEKNFYPLNDADLWEYLVNNDDILIGDIRTRYSFLKEVVKDTVMNNGKIYKVIKFCSCANSSNIPVEYFFHRKDSLGNVYEYIDGNEYMLFNFGLEIDETYESRYENHRWKLVNRYNVIAFGDTLKAIDFHLIDQDGLEKQIAKVTEKFGLTFFSGTPDGYSNFPEWEFWGAIIDSVEYGELIASDRQKVNWSLFYPLHVGNVWKYEHYGVSIIEKSRIKIIKDTLILDEKYFIKNFQRSYLNILEEGRSSVERLDSNGILYSWKNGIAKQSLRFSKCIGDTFHIDNSGDPWLLFDKKEELEFVLIPDFFNAHSFYKEGLGLVGTTGEFTWSGLVGAFINNQLIWPDTSVITSVEKNDELPKEFVLYQNYPNPFNPSTVIEFSIPKSGDIKLEIFNVLGETIEVLFNEFMTAGNYNAPFNASQLSSGIYFYKLTTGRFVQTKKMLLLK